MNVVIVGGRNVGDCICDAREHHWPPTPDEKAHQEECHKVRAWLLMLKIMTRLARDEVTILSPGGLEGADLLAHDAANMMGVTFKVVKPKVGRESFWARIAPKLADKADQVIGVFGPGRIPAGPYEVIQLANDKGKPVHYYHEGAWH